MSWLLFEKDSLIAVLEVKGSGSRVEARATVTVLQRFWWKMVMAWARWRQCRERDVVVFQTWSPEGRLRIRGWIEGWVRTTRNFCRISGLSQWSAGVAINWCETESRVSRRGRRGPEFISGRAKMRVLLCTQRRRQAGSWKDGNWRAWSEYRQTFQGVSLQRRAEKWGWGSQRSEIKRKKCLLFF